MSTKRLKWPWKATVTVAVGPLGEVLEVVDSAGVLTQYDATGNPHDTWSVTAR